MKRHDRFRCRLTEIHYYIFIIKIETIFIRDTKISISDCILQIINI